MPRETEGEAVWPKVLLARLKDLPETLWQAKPGAAAESGPGAEYETYLPASVAEELAEAAERALVACAEGTVTGAEEAQQHLEAALTRYQATKETTDAH